MKNESFSLPEKRILPEGEGEVMSKRKKMHMLSLMNGLFNDIHPKSRPTILDFKGLAEGSGQDEFLEWIKITTDIRPELILADNSTPESQMAYKMLDYAYQRAKDFLKYTLKYRDEEISLRPDCPESISSKEDLFKILSKTVLSRGNKGMSRAPLYCRLAKTTIVAYETLKHSAEALTKITNNFENELISDSSFAIQKTSPLVSIQNSEKGKHFYMAEHGGLKGILTARGKDLQKVMLRFINRAESSAETALKDGIGIRITIEKKQVADLVPILCKWLSEKMNVNFFNIEDKSFFSDKEIKDFNEKLKSSLLEENFNIKKGKSDSTSMGQYEAIVIKGIFHRKGEKFATLSIPARQFEIQIVDVDHRNEKGKMRHEIFDTVKLITARTRLDGGCPEEVFNEFVKDACNASGLGEDKMRYFLLESKDAPILKIKKPNNGRKHSYYVAHSVYERWNGFGWVDGSLMEDINLAVSSPKNKKRR